MNFVFFLVNVKVGEGVKLFGVRVVLKFFFFLVSVGI